MKAGIKRNDIIKSVNGIVSTSEIRFTDLTYNLFPGDEVELEIHDRLRSKSYKLAASLDKSSYSNLMLSRAYLGIGLAVVTGSTREKMALLNRSGELVVSVRENSPADKAGLLVGAVVLSVNGIHLSQDMGLIQMISTLSAGSKAKIEIMLNGSLLPKLEVSLARWP